MVLDEATAPETHLVIGAAVEVHRHLGPGLLEAIYQDALQHEFDLRRIPHEREAAIQVQYKGRLLASQYRCDFICFGSVLVELKASDVVAPASEAQLIHYLRASGHDVGLLLCFGGRTMQVRRFVHRHSDRTVQRQPD